MLPRLGCKPITDITGRRYGRLVVVGYVRPRYWRCLCDCGMECVVFAGALQQNHTRSCGCIRREGPHRSHGLTGTPIHETYYHMLSRCLNSRNRDFKYYGGRGITVCERWQGEHGFENFLADMGPRPEGKTIDRRNNDGNYEPGNCRWATSEQQNQNRRSWK